MSDVRVRFAPSPTGYFHIGSARTALFNWLYAKHTGGTFVLRIEDTDRERNTQEALNVLYEGMRWLGLDWDEGPDAGGDYGPYFQSERAEIYQKYIQKLKDAGRAYEKEGALFFKITGEPQEIEDAVRGKVVRAEEKDFVIVRSDGNPVFHLVNVVDDIEMKITHVIRGEDHLSNTSKHMELFKALGAPVPVFAHIPLILKAQGPGKMSKRDVGSLISEYQQKYYLPDAVRNYLCLLGWSPKDDREVLSIDEIIELFDFPGINKTHARFDDKKLSFINAEYLKQLPVETLAWLARPILTGAEVIGEDADEDYLQSVLRLSQEKIRSLEDLPNFLGYFFKEEFPVDEKAEKKIFKKGDPVERVRELKAGIFGLDTYNAQTLETLVQTLAETQGVGTGEYIQGTRLAVSGTNVGPAFYPMLEVLGKERVLGRMERFLAERVS